MLARVAGLEVLQFVKQVAIGLCWWQHQSCADVMRAVRLAGTGDVSPDYEALCPAVSVHPVPKLFSPYSFFLMDHL